MIDCVGFQVWTERGWINPIDLIIGDVVISYNQNRDCTEYDKITKIYMDYKPNLLYRLKVKSFDMKMTRDHPVLIYNRRTSELKRIPADVASASEYRYQSRLFTNRWFEPYIYTQDDSDVRWSARLAASFSMSRHMPLDYKNQIWNIIKDINGVQAQEWCLTALSWGTPIGDSKYMRSLPLRSVDLRDMLFYVGPRAGLGVKHWPHKIRKKWLISVTDYSDCTIKYRDNWSRERKESYTFNIATKNGNMLSRRQAGTFISACDINERNGY